MFFGILFSSGHLLLKAVSQRQVLQRKNLAHLYAFPDWFQLHSLNESTFAKDNDVNMYHDPDQYFSSGGSMEGSLWSLSVYAAYNEASI